MSMSRYKIRVASSNKHGEAIMYLELESYRLPLLQTLPHIRPTKWNYTLMSKCNGGERIFTKEVQNMKAINTKKAKGSSTSTIYT